MDLVDRFSFFFPFFLHYWHISVEITEIYSHHITTHIFDKTFVKLTFLLKELLKSKELIWRKKFGEMRENFAFFNTSACSVCAPQCGNFRILLSLNYCQNRNFFPWKQYTKGCYSNTSFQKLTFTPISPNFAQ